MVFLRPALVAPCVKDLSAAVTLAAGANTLAALSIEVLNLNAIMSLASRRYPSCVPLRHLVWPVEAVALPLLTAPQ